MGVPTRWAKSILIALFLIFQIMMGPTQMVLGWSNGGYSADPDDPDYGTHDWIAQHALDWLPDIEKDYIENNISRYLYGTELPDRPSGQGGIGDTWWHHIYFFENGTLMPFEDDAAWRADTEYNDTMAALSAGNLSNASMNAGTMAHYISDLAVFGHVMGSPTRDWWGSETPGVHSSYESHVQGQITAYTSSEWDPFLKFDGELGIISAYNATVDLAHNTTFGYNGQFNCTWMNQTANNWSNTDFVNRTGQLLNLAVNAVTDVLHTLAYNSGYSAGKVKRYQVKVNEFEQNPPGNDIGNEWVEIFNPENESANLSRWVLKNNAGKTWYFGNRTILGAEGYMNITFPLEWMDNNNESLTLLSPYGSEIDRTPHFRDEDDDDNTWSRLPNGADTNLTLDWTFQGSTKNATNDPPPINHRPNATFIILPPEGTTDEVFTFDASASSDMDPDVLSFEWSWNDSTPNSVGMVINHTFTLPGSYNITLKVYDNNGSNNSTMRSLNVSAPPPPPDDPPIINSVLAAPSRPGHLDPISVAINVSDDLGVENVTLSYIYSTDLVFGNEHREWTNRSPYEFTIGPFYKNTNLTYHIDVVDTGGNSVRYPLIGNLSIEISPNIRPIANLSVDRTHAFVNEILGFDGNNSTDADGNVTYFFFDLGDGNNTGWIQDGYVEHSYQRSGDYPVTLTVRDEDMDTNTSSRVLIHISVPPIPNRAPYIEIPNIPANISINETLDLILILSDPDGDPLTINLSVGPQGAIISMDDHLYWSPGPDQVGTYSFKIEVSDGEFTVVNSFSVTVDAPLPPPLPPKKPHRAAEDLSWLWLFLAAVAIALAIMVSAWIQAKRRK